MYMYMCTCIHVFESEITFSEKAFGTYSESKLLEPRRISPYDIELTCGQHKISVSYPYCVDYNSLSLKVSKRKKLSQSMPSAQRTTLSKRYPSTCPIPIIHSCYQ